MLPGLYEVTQAATTATTSSSAFDTATRRAVGAVGAIIGMVAGLGVCMYYMSVTYPFFRDLLGVTQPIASYQWWGMNAISAGVFGVPVGLLTIWIVSLLTPAPSTQVQELVDHVRYPVLSGDIETRAT